MEIKIPPEIDQALADLPPAVLGRSGAVFYSGQSAFASSSPIYLLGLNPGGCPIQQRTETVEAHINHFYTQPAEWSSYADEDWGGGNPGMSGMQPEILHLFNKLGLDARTVPASNVAFVRSRGESDLSYEKHTLIEACWPVHAAVIQSLNVGAIVCLGKTAGSWVRGQLGADELVDEFFETNARGWKSLAHRAPNGRMVLTLTHPGRADWRNPAADPSPMVRRWI